MGFRLSPLLWDKVKQGLSAGRVQSVALKMVCERQAEIDAFQPEEYWLLGARLEAESPPPFNARLWAVDGKRLDHKESKVGDAEAAKSSPRRSRPGASSSPPSRRRNRSSARRRPSSPAACSRRRRAGYGFSVKRTMGLAQGLYEGQARSATAARSVSSPTCAPTRPASPTRRSIAAREYIARPSTAVTCCPRSAISYRSKKGAQDAHEAIRPTYLRPAARGRRRPYLQADELKLYRLIWDRFIASQMLPAVFDVTQADIVNGALHFSAPPAR